VNKKLHSFPSASTVDKKIIVSSSVCKLMHSTLHLDTAYLSVHRLWKWVTSFTSQLEKSMKN